MLDWIELNLFIMKKKKTWNLLMKLVISVGLNIIHQNTKEDIGFQEKFI